MRLSSGPSSSGPSNPAGWPRTGWPRTGWPPVEWPTGARRLFHTDDTHTAAHGDGAQRTRCPCRRAHRRNAFGQIGPQAGRVGFWGRTPSDRPKVPGVIRFPEARLRQPPFFCHHLGGTAIGGERIKVALLTHPHDRSAKVSARVPRTRPGDVKMRESRHVRAAIVERPHGQGFGSSGRSIVRRPAGKNSPKTLPEEITVSIRAKFIDMRLNAEATR